MIGKNIEKMLSSNRELMMIPAENVATIRSENTLMHAMMVLSTVGYSAIPVLDRSGHLKGVLSIPRIINAIKDSETYNWDLLNTCRVRDIICDEYAVVHPDAELEDILHALVDHNFISVADNKGRFCGIITRKEILKRINNLAHEFEQTYTVLEPDVLTPPGELPEAKKPERRQTSLSFRQGRRRPADRQLVGQTW